MRRIVILGATGHIGRALAARYAAREDTLLVLYSRCPHATAQMHLGNSRISHRHVSDLILENVDVVVNAIGVGNPARVPLEGSNIFGLTMHFEDVIDRQLTSSPHCLTVFMSSGAVYGPRSSPARPNASASHNINSPRPEDFYGLSKIGAELRHRAQTNRRVVDIRIFGFLSAHLDLQKRYFMAEVYSALLSGTTFLTHKGDMTRDYVGAEELISIIDAAAEKEKINTPLDAYSKLPASKFDILRRLEAVGLRWRISNDYVSPISRVNYFSEWHKAEDIGYSPWRTSGDIAEEVALELLKRN